MQNVCQQISRVLPVNWVFTMCEPHMAPLNRFAAAEPGNQAEPGSQADSS